MIKKGIMMINKNKVLGFFDVILRVLFALFGVYLVVIHSPDNLVNIAGYAILLFNIITTFFDFNYHKTSKS